MNGNAPVAMPRVMMTSIAALSKCPTDASLVENPPVAMVVIAWAIASNCDIPAHQSMMAQSAVKLRYRTAMPMAIWVARGKALSDLSEFSMRKSCIPPTRSIGITAIAITMIPIPPSHCKSARHNKIPCGAVSRPTITVDPVVEMPDIASKNASV